MLDNCEHLVAAVVDLVVGLRASVSEPQLPADQPAATAAQRRGRHRRPTAQPPRPGDRGHAGGHRPLRGGRPVPGPRHVGTIRLQADPGQRTGGRRAVPRAGRSPAGHRARRGQDQGAVAAGDLRQPRRTVDGAQPRATATPRPGTSHCAPASSGPTTCAPRSSRRFWARSSVFVGGYDLEAAAAVCGADDLPAEEVLDLVSGLVDQSVVLAEEAAPGHTRYRMLTDIRQFGLDRAEKDGELHGIQQRHATLVRRAGLPVRRRRVRAAPGRLVAAATTGAGQPADRHRVLRAGQRTTPRPPWSWPGSSTCTGRPPDCSTRHATGWRSGWPRAPGRRRSEPSRWPWRPGSRSCRTTDSGPGS